jgi:hypothetical protein
MGHLLKIICVDSRVNVHILAATRVPFILSTVQVPNLAVSHTKRITVWGTGELMHVGREELWLGTPKKKAQAAHFTSGTRA